MSRLLIEYTDYQKLIELASKNINQEDTFELDLIVKKYSVPRLMNEIKVNLWKEVKKYSKGTESNKIAYDKYKEFDNFITNLKEHIKDKNITFEMLTDKVKSMELEIKEIGIQA